MNSIFTIYGPKTRGNHLKRSVATKFLFCTLLLFSYIPLLSANKDARPKADDPIQLCKQLIEAHPEHWNQEASKPILEKFGLDRELEKKERIYRLLESPGLTLDFLIGEDGEAEKYLSKAHFLELLRNAVQYPQTTSRKIAQATLQLGLEEYATAFRIAGEYQSSSKLTHEDAISFLDNRYGYAKLEDASKLLGADAQETASAWDNKKVKDKLRAIEKGYPDNIGVEDALKEVYEFYRILEEEQLGLAAYEPYTRFKSIMEQLNKSRIAQRRKFRSSIQITNPDNATIWMLNDPVALAWSTSNISDDKSLRFFLVKGEMVVQELGTFKNTGTASGIRLNKNIDSGTDYRVVAIELFPVNKNFIAKVASSSFTIQRPERKKAPIAAREIPPIEKVANVAIQQIPVHTEPDSLRYERMSFEGRKISYVKELTVDAENIRISIWDHGRQDQDIVSIYLNGEPVVSKHYLTYHKKHFDIHLERDKKNDLFLYAHNLGFYPPNTVSIEVIDNSTSENIVLNSTLQSCEAVLINVSP